MVYSNPQEPLRIYGSSGYSYPSHDTSTLPNLYALSMSVLHSHWTSYPSDPLFVHCTTCGTKAPHPADPPTHFNCGTGALRREFVILPLYKVNVLTSESKTPSLPLLRDEDTIPRWIYTMKISKCRQNSFDLDIFFCSWIFVVFDNNVNITA